MAEGIIPVPEIYENTHVITSTNQSNSFCFVIYMEQNRTETAETTIVYTLELNPLQNDLEITSAE